MKQLAFTLAFAVLSLAAPAAAQDMSTFRTGPVFETFGPHAPVEGMGEVPADTEFAVTFDVVEPAEEGKRSRGIESAARFINMHVAAGVDPDNIRIAVVVHGKASLDLLHDVAWAARPPAEEEAVARAQAELGEDAGESDLIRVALKRAAG